MLNLFSYSEQNNTVHGACEQNPEEVNIWT